MRLWCRADILSIELNFAKLGVPLFVEFLENLSDI